MEQYGAKYHYTQACGLLVFDTGLAGRRTAGVYVQTESKDLLGESVETRGGKIQSILADLRQRARAQDRLRGLSLAEVENAAGAGKLLPVGDGLLRRQVQQRGLRGDER